MQHDRELLQQIREFMRRICAKYDTVVKVPLNLGELVPYQSGPNRTRTERTLVGSANPFNKSEGYAKGAIPGTRRGASPVVTMDARAARAALRAAQVSKGIFGLTPAGLARNLVYELAQAAQPWVRHPHAWYGPVGWQKCCAIPTAVTDILYYSQSLACNVCSTSGQSVAGAPRFAIDSYDFTQTIAVNIQSYVVVRVSQGGLVRWGYGWLFKKPSGQVLPSPRRLVVLVVNRLPREVVNLSRDGPRPPGDLTWPTREDYPLPRPSERRKGLAQRGYALAAAVYDKADEVSQVIDILWSNLGRKCRGGGGKNRFEKAQDILRCAGTINLPQTLADLLVN